METTTKVLTGVWKWIDHDGQHLRNIGIKRDGSLHNPNGYDEAIVCEAIRQASESVHARRSEAAKRAAATKRQRRERRVYDVVRKILAHESCGPRRHCVICGKALGDSESIARGIGSDCWQDVLAAISASRAGATATA
jgi:hypothetical protein